MPIYPFRCPRCQTEFELSRPMKDASNPALCPHDGETAVRIFTALTTLGRAGSEPSSTPAAEGAAPADPLGGAGGHGHSHGPGGHTHPHF